LQRIDMHPHPKLAAAFRAVELRPPRKGEVGRALASVEEISRMFGQIGTLLASA
jgi:hypothetical protein